MFKRPIKKVDDDGGKVKVKEEKCEVCALVNDLHAILQCLYHQL